MKALGSGQGLKFTARHSKLSKQHTQVEVDGAFQTPETTPDILVFSKMPSQRALGLGETSG